MNEIIWIIFSYQSFITRQFDDCASDDIISTLQMCCNKNILNRIIIIHRSSQLAMNLDQGLKFDLPAGVLDSTTGDGSGSAEGFDSTLSTSWNTQIEYHRWGSNRFTELPWGYLRRRRLSLRRFVKSSANLLPYIVETVLTHVINVALLPPLSSHVFLKRWLLRASRLTQRQLRQGSGDTSLPKTTNNTFAIYRDEIIMGTAHLF